MRQAHVVVLLAHLVCTGVISFIWGQEWWRSDGSWGLVPLPQDSHFTELCSTVETAGHLGHTIPTKGQLFPLLR